MDDYQEDQIEPYLLYDAVRILDTPLEDLHYQAIESQFPWVKKGRLIWVRKPDFDCVVYWQKPDRSFIVLNGKRKLEDISDLLRANIGRLPGQLFGSELAAALRKLTVEPRGFLADRSFVEKMRPYLSSWAPSKDLEGVLISECRDAALRPGNNAWTLEFRYINPRGGIEGWIGHGDTERVTTLDMNTVVPDGTFRFPYR